MSSSNIEDRLIKLIKENKLNNKALWHSFVEACEQYGTNEACEIFKDVFYKNGVTSLKLGIGKTLSNCAWLSRKAQRNNISLRDDNGEIKGKSKLENECRKIVFDLSSIEKQKVEQALKIIRNNPRYFIKEITELYNLVTKTK